MVPELEEGPGTRQDGLLRFQPEGVGRDLIRIFHPHLKFALENKGRLRHQGHDVDLGMPVRFDFPRRQAEIVQKIPGEPAVGISAIEKRKDPRAVGHLNTLSHRKYSLQRVSPGR